MAFDRKLTVTIVGDSKGLRKAFKQADKAGAKFSRGIKKVGTATAAGLLAVGTGSVKAFLNFDDAMTKSLSIMGDVSDSMRGDMASAAREIAKVTRVSATEAADSFFYLGSAGLSAAESIEALPKVAAFATAGAFDMALATDLLTDAQSALGLTVDDTAKNMLNMTAVSDVLVKANTLANATVQQFSESLTNKAGAAIRALGKDMEEGVAVLAAFADQGVKGTEAGTALAIVLRDLQTASLANTDNWKALGISTFDAQGEMRNMADVVADLEGVLGGASDKQKKMTLQQLGFKDKSQGFLLTLLGQSAAIRDYEEALRDAGGTTEEVADKQLESAAAKFDMFKSKVIDAGISLGENLVPKLLEAAENLEAFVGWFTELEPAVQKTIIAIGALSAALFVFHAHPAIAALGLIAVGILAIGAAAKENKVEVGLLTDELIELGEVQVNTLADVIGKIPEKDIATLDRLGLSLIDVKTGLEDNAFASDQASLAWLKVNATAGNAQRGTFNLRQALEHLQNQFNDASVAAAAYAEDQALAAEATDLLALVANRKAAPALAGLTTTTGESRAATEEATAAWHEQTLSLTDIANAAGRAEAAQRKLTESFLEANDPALALLKAGREYDEALKGLHKTQKDSKASADDLEDAQLRVFGAYENLVGASSTFADDQEAISAFRALATQAGLSKTEIDKIVGSIQTYNALDVAQKTFRVAASRLAVFDEIRNFHSGGIVPGVKGEEVLAKLEAGEGVVSAAAMATRPSSGGTSGSTSGGNVVNLHVHIEGRSAQTDRQLVDMILDKAARQSKHAGRYNS